MKARLRNNGSAFLLVVFVIALLAAVVMGMLQINTEEIQVMRNQIYSAEALAIAEAGLNDAFAKLRADDEWDEWESGGWDEGLLEDKSFNGGSYTVQVSNYTGGGSSDLTIVSEGTSSQGFVAKIAADITVGSSSPHMIRIDELRINDEQDQIDGDDDDDDDDDDD